MNSAGPRKMTSGSSLTSGRCLAICAIDSRKFCDTTATPNMNGTLTMLRSWIQPRPTSSFAPDFNDAYPSSTAGRLLYSAQPSR